MGTDAATNMTKAVKQARATYPQMIHVTCILHGINRVVDTMVNTYPLARNFAMAIKGIILRSPYRRALLKELFPDLNIPPEPVETRWASLLEALPYHVKHFEKMKQFVNHLISTKQKSAQISTAQELMNNPQTLHQIQELSSRYGFLVEHIKVLQHRDLSTSHVFDIANEITQEFCKYEDIIGQQVFAKWKAVTEKNTGLELISRLVNGDEIDEEFLIKENLPRIKPENIPFYRKAVLVTAENERLFSAYNNIFSPQRHSLKVETIDEIVAISKNSQGKT